MRWSAFVLILALALLSVPGCGSSDEPATGKASPCRAADVAAGMDSFAADDVGVYLDAPQSAGIDVLRSDLQKYLPALWGLSSISVQDGGPDGSKALSIWITTSNAAGEPLGVTLTDGYALRRSDQSVTVYAADEANLAIGTYGFLEQLGARFFHSKAELVPSLGGVRLPKTLDLVRKPAWRTRGIQEHTLHPIEMMSVLNEASPEHLADAKQYVDWLVKTGQNLIQWPLMDTVAWTEFAPHARAIADYAHSRGVRVGAVVQMFAESSLQNNYVLIQSDATWQANLEAKLDQLLGVEWDVVELALGEFIGANPADVITWLDHATNYVSGKSPNVELSAQIHVGNYPNLWVDYQGKKTFFYHLAGYANDKLGSSVHTVFLFDLYRDWGTYKHDNFFLQREYLMSQLPNRKMRYFPESAYWIAADVDVPQFLPEYIYSRWLDISSLSKDIREQGLPALDGHVMFSSGKEWGYWLTDYLAAKMQWDPEAPFDSFLGHYTHYAWGYLRQTHTACFWHRQDIQAETLISDGFPAGFSILPSCDD